MRLFRKHKVARVSDTAAQRIAGAVIRLQRGFAARMGKISGEWTQGQKKVFLAVVCLGFVALSTTAVVQPFTSNRRISAPKQIVVPAIIKEESQPVITEEEFQSIQRLKRSLDSTKIKQRPGLIDSIRMVEQLYYSNLK